MVPLDLTIAHRRRHRLAGGLQALVGRWYLLRRRVIRRQRFIERHRRTCASDALQLLQKPAAIQVAVNELVVDLDCVRRYFRSVLLHNLSPGKAASQTAAVVRGIRLSSPKGLPGGDM